jgi:hypothetical protein
MKSKNHEANLVAGCVRTSICGTVEDDDEIVIRELNILPSLLPLSLSPLFILTTA